MRFIGEKYEDGIKNLKQTLKEQGLDPEDENIRAAFFDDATFADGTYNLPPEARWSTIISTPAPQLNVALDTALQRLEEEDPQLKGCFVKGTFTARNLAANDIKKIYLPMGFENFKIEGRGLGSALVLEFLLYYMVKPEYQICVREEVYLDNMLDLF